MNPQWLDDAPPVAKNHVTVQLRIPETVVEMVLAHKKIDTIPAEDVLTIMRPYWIFMMYGVGADDASLVKLREVLTKVLRAYPLHSLDLSEIIVATGPNYDTLALKAESDVLRVLRGELIGNFWGTHVDPYVYDWHPHLSVRRIRKGMAHGFVNGLSQPLLKRRLSVPVHSIEVLRWPDNVIEVFTPHGHLTDYR